MQKLQNAKSLTSNDIRQVVPKKSNRIVGNDKASCRGNEGLKTREARLSNRGTIGVKPKGAGMCMGFACSFQTQALPAPGREGPNRSMAGIIAVAILHAIAPRVFLPVHVAGSIAVRVDRAQWPQSDGRLTPRGSGQGQRQHRSPMVGGSDRSGGKTTPG